MTGVDDRTRRMRAHQFAGAAALVLAVGSLPVFGAIAALGMLLIGIGNMLAARAVKADGRMSTASRVLIVVGGVVFVAMIVTLVVGAVNGP